MQAMLDMSTTAQIQDSPKLGNEVWRRWPRRPGCKAPGRAGWFRPVLKAPDVPSILVETAFILQPRGRTAAARPAYQAQLVDALTTGIRRYFAKNPPLARNRQL